MSTILRLVLSIALLLALAPAAFAQTTVYVQEDADATLPLVHITRRASFPDIRVLLGRDIMLEDLTVGITPYRTQADIVVTRRAIDAARAVRLDNCEAFPDLTIVYGERISFPDIRIEFRDDNRPVDYLIYTEKTTLSEQELIACLLPIIQEKTRD